MEILNWASQNQGLIELGLIISFMTVTGLGLFFFFLEIAEKISKKG